MSIKSAVSKKPVRIAVTGAAGAIAYSLLFRLAHGDMLGKDQPVILHLVDLPVAVDKMKGVAMELNDCAFPPLKDIVLTDDLSVGFKDIDYAFLVGARPRGPGMERSDLMKANAEIFSTQGKALNKYASRGLKTIVVGNPANTNCLIAASNAPDLDANNFSAMTRLDQNRALTQLAQKLNVGVEDIEKFTIWGNHSSTMYPDITQATVQGKGLASLLDKSWITDKFIPEVAQRGAAIIKARGASSAASAASAAVDHMRDWALGSNGKWVSMGIPSDGSYGIEKGVYYSVPVTTTPGSYKKVDGLSVDAFSRERMDKTKKELFEEREMVKHLLGENKQLKQ